MIRYALIVAGLLLAAAVTGCAGLERPTAELRDVQLVEQTEDGARFELTVEAHNPNDVALPVPAAEYVLEIGETGEQRWVRLSDNPPRVLRPMGSQTFVLPVSVASDEPLAGRAYQASGNLRYQPPGRVRELLTQYGLPRPSLHFSATGELE